MKKVLLLLVVSLLYANSYGQRQCGAMEHLHNEIQQNPDRGKILEDIESHTSKWIKRKSKTSLRSVITIPIVVHVVYRTPTENISDAQIQTQIDVLNADFRRLNADANDIWPQAADSEIEFCLASFDPNGNVTSGITRTSTNVNGFGTNDAVKFSSSGGKDAWPSGDYLNFWVCNIGGGILGYAQFPGGSSATDGVVNGYQYTGTIGSATTPFDLGRTATHEVGHWLNLRHVWGDGGCNVDDLVSDTPASDAANYGCAIGHSSCNSTDMVQNYMDYSDDACMNIFTAGQKSRMHALFSTGGARSSILNSGGCGNEPPSGCDNNVTLITINFDNYPKETAWSLTNSAGVTVASGGPYGAQTDGSTLVVEECLVDGCYDFTMTDTYGDGICCYYGNGSYSVTNEGSILASGASFGTTETTNICVEGGSPDPTCSDGVQNGDEIGIDCGGPDCVSCESCDDGAQNGNETGIDCGGTDCPACPTCSDGVQNGDETGIDCGGINCDVCESCDDGIQNGNETGVDCGGSDCTPCSSSGSEELFAHYFESGWDGWQDGGSDCYRYSGARSYEGNYSIRLRDNSGTVSSMTSSDYNVSDYSAIEIEFYFYPNSMESGEDLFVRYYDGSNWNTVASYVSGTDFNNNTFYSASVTVSAADYNFASNSKFRFQCDASANADRIYIDQVTVTGISSSSRLEGISSRSIKQLRSVSETRLIEDEDEFSIYPNPVFSDMNILSEDNINRLKVYSITGKLLMVSNVDNTQAVIDLSLFDSGIYMISIETDEEVMTKKFIKQ